MRPRHFKTRHNIPSESSYSLPTGRTFRQAWGLFVFSSIFAVLFNAFYVDGIELKYQPIIHKWPAGQPSPAPTYIGFSTPTASSPISTPTPLPGPSDSFTRLSLMGAKQRFDKKTVIFMDARKPEEYQEGHIPGSLNFFGEEPDKFAPIVMPQLTDKKQEIVVYCHGGDCDLSLQTAKSLKEAGFTHIEIFQGGWPAWTQAGYEVKTGEAP
jgi:rhodanese-related sulfurtransferase